MTTKKTTTSPTKSAKAKKGVAVGPVRAFRQKLDYPVVMGSVLLSAFLFVLINIMADVLYGVVDPRVRATA